ncbi:Putative uncharacterized protein [Moritella viscosa]|nr:Putative uncharacterized protein [Moritella viscosa]SHO21912.1 Putative uncharacterized protein [Moritella viscosa]
MKLNSVRFSQYKISCNSVLTGLRKGQEKVALWTGGEVTT